MKLHLNISDQVLEDSVTIEAHSYTRQIAQLTDFIKTLDNPIERLKAKKGETVHLLAPQDVYRLVIEDKVVHLKTLDQDFTTAYRLYQVKDLLSTDFLQISQSEIINLKQLDHLQVTPNGLVKLILKNGDVTYSSRRYLKAIKEALNL
ncbi:LytTR family DNA-binding domain-containing protein [Streptococcus moroccensis]|uniref:DNA-binding LytR/AlgR family response regulator n=1 Tax=Streptococcus moroccensis TaxID=1451356 RepID=A0ABT9YU33_9STRE|nr:LytTR family DNA-binding domain-containing protein [Streptococcus moroccensis]MDQ0222620.1 DNA-binding LytR/AlgR family response regulator [Streptococcus moroccensis]